MSKRKFKKGKKDSFFQKIVNFVLTILVACVISSQVCTAANNNLRFAQVSDVHFSSFENNTSYKMLKNSQDLLKDTIFQINTSGPYNFVIFTGDLINTPKSSELTKFLDNTKSLKYPWYAINGNHDIVIDGKLTKNEFMNILKSENKQISADKPYYAFTPKRGFRVICLDSIIDYRVTTNGELSQDEIQWLKRELDSHTGSVIILATHVPIDEPYSSPNHKLNNESEIKNILKQYKNPIVVLQGHYHATKAKQKENIIYISCPSLVTFPNAFRVVNIHTNKKKTTVDIFLKETNLKDVQNSAKIRVLGTELLYGGEEDRNITFEIKKE